jgi:hypothetical protein
MVGSTDFFEINLHDGDGNVLLGIDDGNTGQKLVFEIVNTSGKDITLNALDLAKAENNNKYHFSFAFRLGTISSNTFNTITPKVFINSSEPNHASFGNGDQWEFKRDDKTQSFYLVSKIEKVFPVNKTITFVLEKISASPDGGARGTRVEIKYDNLKLGDTVLTGNRLKNLNILNQRGKKQVPLYVGFIGSNMILNDGSENTLTLSIQLLPLLETALGIKSLDKNSSDLPEIDINSEIKKISIDSNKFTALQSNILQSYLFPEILSFIEPLSKVQVPVLGQISDIFNINIPNMPNLGNDVLNLASDLSQTLKAASTDSSQKYGKLKAFLTNSSVKVLLTTQLKQTFTNNLLDKLANNLLDKLINPSLKVVPKNEIIPLLSILQDLGLFFQDLSDTKLNEFKIIDQVVDNIQRSLSSQEVPLKALDEAIKFTISFDVATADDHQPLNNQWALVSQNEADNIRPEIAKDSPHPEKWIYGGLQKQGITPQWSFICTQGLNLEERSEILRLRISNIKTTLLAGYANLYVHYENIPGYWDGHITVPIHKGPLVYREKEISIGKDQTVKVGCVGIGTDKPQAKLHVKKDDLLPLALVVEGDTSIVGNLFVDGKMGIGTPDPQANLHIEKDSSLPLTLCVGGDTEVFGKLKITLADQVFSPSVDEDGNEIDLAGNLDSAYFTDTWNKNKPFVSIGINENNVFLALKAPKADGYSESYAVHPWELKAQDLNTNSGDEESAFYISNPPSSDPKLVIKSNGNVGIGTSNPTYKLEVNGDISVGSSNNSNMDQVYGNKLYFLGASDNSDPVWIARYNYYAEKTSLRINLGDDGNKGENKLEIGYTDYSNSKNWVSAFYIDYSGINNASDITAFSISIWDKIGTVSKEG